VQYLGSIRQESGSRARFGSVLGAMVFLALPAPLAIPTGAGAAHRAQAVTVRVTIHGHPGGNVISPGTITFVPDKVKAGTKVTFRITNTDIRGHNFLINGRQTREMGPHRGQGVLQVTFRKPGQYSASCPDDNHSGIGGVLDVT
jgi:plastocyanin